jgi:hypothetical protein
MKRVASILLLAILLFTGCSSVASRPGTAKNPLRALYLDYNKSNSLSFVERLVDQGKPHGINALVLDAQVYGGRRAYHSPEVVAYLKSRGVMVISRIVCFQDGLTRLPIPERTAGELDTMIETVCQAGADEVQLDYIRFADAGLGYSYERKYQAIGEVLDRARAITARHKVLLSADVFGRIPYNRNDPVGQQMELFARHVDIIYPMLYPSHFSADRYRMSNPGETVREGTMKGFERVAGTKVRVIPWIQAFNYQIGHARVGLVRYIELQIEAAEGTPAHGWLAWNAYGDYRPVFEALGNLRGASGQ